MPNHGILIAISSVSLFVTCLVLAVFVAKNSANKTHKLWAAFNLVVAIWGLGVFIATLTAKESLAFAAWQMAHLGGLFIPVLFFNFVNNICGNKNRTLTLFFYAQASLFAALSIFGYTGYRVTKTFDMGYYILVHGSLYYFVTALWFLPVIIGFGMMLKFLRNSEGLKKSQAKYLLGSMFLGFAGGPQHFLPAYGIGFNPFLGNFLIGIYALVASYAIFKHKLLDVDVVVRRAAVFAGLFAFVYGIVALFTALGQQYFVDKLGWPIWFAMIPSIFVIVLALRPLETWLTNATDRHLFQKKYDYRELMRLFTTEVLTIFDIETIAQHTVEALDNIIKLESCVVVLSDDGGQYKIAAARGIRDADIQFGLDDSIVQYLRNSKEPVIRDSVAKRAGTPKKLLESLKQLDSSICLPIMIHKEFMGFLSLGAKKSGEDYTADDIDVLGSLARAEAIAIKNARVNADLVKAKARQHLGDMADGMSHQFNNRFGTIVALLGFQEILIPEALGECEKSGSQEQNQKLRETLDQALKAIAEARDSAYRGGEIAKTLLVHTRPEKIGFGMYDIGKGIPLGLNLVALKHDDFKAIRIVQSVDNPLPATWCSLSIIQEILPITLDNAYDAIKTRQQESPGHEGVIQIQVTHRLAESNIRMVVKDNGVGMKTADLEKVKTGVPYFTTKGSASQKSGYGAGVHTLGEYVSILRGRHRYESQYGEGTSCVIDIPVSHKPVEIMEPADGKNSHSR